MAATVKVATLVFIGLVSLASRSPAADYSSMTTEELSQLRGTLQTASQEERDAFRSEWLERVQSMTATERQAYGNAGNGYGNGAGNAAGAGSANGTGTGTGTADCDGTAKGPGNGDGSGGASGGGKGNGPGGGRGNGPGRS